MSVSNEQVEETVRRYLGLVSNGTADEIAAMYAEDAVLEDPVGSEPNRGREAIHAFYSAIKGMKVSAELQSIRTCGGEAAFTFHIETDTGSGIVVLEPFENMAIGEDGLITSMRAWWNDGDMSFV